MEIKTFHLIFPVILLNLLLHFPEKGNGVSSYSSDTSSLCHPTAEWILPDQLSETSGLCWWDNAIWSLNDSGNDPVIFKLNPDNGSVLQSIRLAGIRNVDWEEIFTDNKYFYIADIGNNDGTRDTLWIYKIPVQLLSGNIVENKDIGKISYRYENQKNRGVELYSTPFDAEAFITMDEKIIVFTKDWVRNSTTLFEIPNRPGFHIAEMIQRMNCHGLVTGATISEKLNCVYLVGYQNFVPVLWNFPLGSFNVKSIQSWSRITCFEFYGIQTEGITVDPHGYVYISSENSRDPAKLFKYSSLP